jgi:predicted nucleic acid-binding protein
MQATIIADTSCLILLEKIGELSLLHTIFGEIVTTQFIADEFGEVLPYWITIQNPMNKSSQLLLEITLDKGEASAIALALEMGNSLLIIDEAKGRKIAKQVGLTITGTLGVLAQAKLKGHIQVLKPLLEKIQQTNFRISEQLVQEVLKAVGE